MQNGVFAHIGTERSRSSGLAAQLDKGCCYTSIYSIVSNDSVSLQQRSWSDCASWLLLFAFIRMAHSQISRLIYMHCWSDNNRVSFYSVECICWYFFRIPCRPYRLFSYLHLDWKISGIFFAPLRLVFPLGVKILAILPNILSSVSVIVSVIVLIYIIRFI